MRCTSRQVTGRQALVVAAALALSTLLGCGAVPPAPDRPTQTSSAAPDESTPPATPGAPQRSTEPAAPSTPPSDTDAQVATVVRISDGDTIVTTAGKVRLIGIDTPEQGECGYFEAGEQAAALVPIGSEVTLVAVAGKDDTDGYGRLLRYVENSAGIDLGLSQLAAGYAVARYDSRDGYGSHPREQQYIAADRAAPRYTCPAGNG